MQPNEKQMNFLGITRSNGRLLIVELSYNFIAYICATCMCGISRRSACSSNVGYTCGQSFAAKRYVDRWRDIDRRRAFATFVSSETAVLAQQRTRWKNLDIVKYGWYAFFDALL